MVVLAFFFFKQKSAYEMLRSLVGSEMCIRDRRGAAPIQRALLAGDVETGITIIQMDRGLDTGAMPVSYTHLTLPTIYSV